jgi:hypothetical protein
MKTTSGRYSINSMFMQRLPRRLWRAGAYGFLLLQGSRRRNMG